jgi:hypothetical protein
MGGKSAISLKEQDRFGDLVIDVRIIIKWIAVL